MLLLLYLVNFYSQLTVTATSSDALLVINVCTPVTDVMAILTVMMGVMSITARLVSILEQSDQFLILLEI